MRRYFDLSTPNDDALRRRLERPVSRLAGLATAALGAGLVGWFYAIAKLS